jgi:hypothetical protein
MNTKMTAILNATRATEFDILPFLMGDVSLDQWVASIKGKTVVTRKGHLVSALAQATWHGNAQRALNAVSLAMKIACDTKQINWVKAAGIANKAHKRLELLMASIAATREQRDEMLFPLADIRVATKEGSFSAFQSGGEEPYTEDELVEMGWDWERIEDFLGLQEATRSTAPESSGEGSTSDSEGWYRTTLHSVGQLGDIPLNQIQFGEWIAAKALVSTVAWPTGPVFDRFLERVMGAWEGRLEFIRSDKKMTAVEKTKAIQEELEKQAKRTTDLEDIGAKPLHVRWTVNHLARRAWRDIQMLKREVARHEARVDELIQLDYIEERFGPDSEEFKAQMGRVNLGEANEQTRKAFFLGYADLDEADVGRAALSEITQAKYAGKREFGETETEVGYAFVAPEYRMSSEGIEVRARHSREEVIGRGRMIHDLDGNEIEIDIRTRQVEDSDLQHDTPFRKELAWANACLETAQDALSVATQMHKHLRHMDLELAVLWEISLEEQANELNMPAHPPVYWNRDGHYQTEAEALAALDKELAEGKLRRALSVEEALIEAIAGVSNNELMK